MLVFQSCAYSQHILPCSSSKIFAASCDCACSMGSVKVEEDVFVMEESFTAINTVADIAIKQEEIPEDTTFPEPYEVSYVCICVIRHIIPLSVNLSCFYDINISGHVKQLHFQE